MTMVTEYTLKQISEHDAPEDAWIILHGKVYDVSGYLEEHPGGKDILMEFAGSDATSDFDFAGHSEDARNTLSTFQVGTVSGYDSGPRKDRPTRGTLLEVSKGLVAPALPLKSLKLKAWVGVISTCAGLSATANILSRLSIPTIPGSYFGLLSAVPLTLIIAGYMFFSSVKRKLFHYKEVFAYEPYY